MSNSNGILKPKQAEQKFELTRHLPSSDDLAYFVLRYWIVSWDLRGQPPYLQENIPNPCVNLVIEQGKSRVYGVETGKSSVLLQGKAAAFGVKFRPGGFYPFLKQPIVQITDTSISLREAFGVDSTAVEQAILATDDHATMIRLFEDFLLAHLPAADPTVAQINQIVDRISADRTITRVDDIADRLNISKRTLQRLFRQYVGVSPKWVIQHYRLHDAADQLANGEAPDLSALALNLGYFDQAHFIKDFKAMVGSTPLEYAKLAGA